MNTRKATRKTTRSKTRKVAARKPASRTAKTKSRSTAKSVSTSSRPAIRTAWTKSEIISGIVENTGLARKQVSHVFCELESLISAHIRQGAAGMFTLPGIMKVITKRKPATKARKGINPFSGEEVMFKAKPARTIVKIRPLKKVKEMVC